MVRKMDDIDFVRWWILESDQEVIYIESGDSVDTELEIGRSEVLEALERLRYLISPKENIR